MVRGEVGGADLDDELPLELVRGGQLSGVGIKFLHHQHICRGGAIAHNTHTHHVHTPPKNSLKSRAMIFCWLISQCCSMERMMG